MVMEISAEEMYKIIKKQNGEEFAKVLRANVLLDVPNLQHMLEYAGKNPEDVASLVPMLREVREKLNIAPVIKTEEVKDPLELLDEAGYDAFYVNSLHQQNSIKKYFASGEELCTFSDSSRYKNYYIIHAVKKDVKNIKRQKQPAREDEYGTSVISIQIAKNGGFISIKNRYNHTVDNPDATFNNNPDNIIPGLTESLKHKFGVDFISQKARLPYNYRIINDQFVHFNYEIDNIYYDEKYYFDGSKIKKLNTDYEIMLDTVVLNTKTDTIRSVKDFGTLVLDPEHGNSRYVMEQNLMLARILDEEISGHKITIGKDKKTGETIINIIDENKNVKELARTRNGCITSLHLYKTEDIGSEFLKYNKVLKELYAPKLKKMGEFCFNRNERLKTLYLPELIEMGRLCFHNNQEITNLSLPKLKKMGHSCFADDGLIKQLDIPELEEMGVSCFIHTYELTDFRAPKLKRMENCCFEYNEKLKTIYVPELEEMGDDFANVKHLREFIAPKLKKMGNGFRYGNFAFATFYAPELEEVGKYSFENVSVIKNLYVPKLQITKDTPKCIRRGVKLTRFTDAIKKIFRLQKHNVNTLPQPEKVM